MASHPADSRDDYSMTDECENRQYDIETNPVPPSPSLPLVVLPQFNTYRPIFQVQSSYFSSNVCMGHP